MQTESLPSAVIFEREAMLYSAVDQFRHAGHPVRAVHGLRGFKEPPKLQIPVWNAPMRPDIYAEDSDGHPILGLVEVSTALGEESCGRRWQAFSLWDEHHTGRLCIFVHPEDRRRAERIANHWGVARHNIHVLERRRGAA